METPLQSSEMFTHYLSLLTIVGAVVVVGLLLMLAYSWISNKENKLFSLTSAYIFPLGFLVSFGGVFLTLYYEYGLKYLPCDLCWYQRIFLYPQMFMFAYAWYKKDVSVLPYTLILSVVGLVIATYHHLLQMGYDVYKPCSTAPFAVSCSEPPFLEFGFVSFPFMAMVLFGFLSIVIVAAIKSKK